MLPKRTSTKRAKDIGRITDSKNAARRYRRFLRDNPKELLALEIWESAALATRPEALTP